MLDSFDWNTGPLREGLHCYRTEQFFEAHEHWERVWLTLSEPEKSFLQALIQVSAAFHHLRGANRSGAVSLLTRALERLDRCPSEFGSLDVALLREQARQWRAWILADQAKEPPSSFPEFRTMDR